MELMKTNPTSTTSKPEQNLSAEAKKLLSTRNNGGGGHCQGGGGW
jgi:hypothetical protein